MESKKRNVLLCCTGSVASVKCTELAKKLSTLFNLRVVLSQKAAHFANKSELETLGIQTYTDQDEWDSWSKMGDPVIHIELSEWADVVLVAPLSANSLAKLANGISDNLIVSHSTRDECGGQQMPLGDQTCVLRALPFDKETKRVSTWVFVCPAMNTRMWDHPVTEEHVEKVRKWGFHVVEPIVKMLACKTEGKGAMENVDSIVSVVSKLAYEEQIEYLSNLAAFK